MERAGSRGSHHKDRSKSRSVFGGKKSWIKNDNGMDPDINEAIEKIEAMQKQLEDIENENQLLLGENRKFCKDVKDYESIIEALNLQIKDLEEAKLDAEDQLQKALKKKSELQSNDEES